jgi:hypothetical protein
MKILFFLKCGKVGNKGFERFAEDGCKMKYCLSFNRRFQPTVKDLAIKISCYSAINLKTYTLSDTIFRIYIP